MGAVLRARLTHQKPHIKNKTQNKIPNPNTLSSQKLSNTNSPSDRVVLTTPLPSVLEC